MPKFRKKPVVIEARETGRDHDEDCEIMQWCGGRLTALSSDTLFVIPTLEGVMEVSSGDFVIKGVKNEFYPCKPDIFDATYDYEPDGV